MPCQSLSSKMDSVLTHDTEMSKTTFYFWPITDMSSSVGARWRSCLTVTVLCHSTWMTWRRRTSASSSASTSWRREYSKSTRRAVKMSTVRWVAWGHEWKPVWVAMNGMMNGTISGMRSCSSGAKGRSTNNKIITNHWFTGRLADNQNSSFVPLRIITGDRHHVSIQLCYPAELLYWATSTVCWPSCHADLVEVMWPAMCLLYHEPVFRSDCPVKDYTLTSSLLMNLDLIHLCAPSCHLLCCALLSYTGIVCL